MKASELREVCFPVCIEISSECESGLYSMQGGLLYIPALPTFKL